MFNGYVNKKYVSEYLENEIKEISQRWAQYMVNRIALSKEMKSWIDLPEKVEKKYQKIVETVQSKNEADRKKYFAKMTDGERAKYDAFVSKKEKTKALDNAEKGLKEFEEFLEVATDLKADIEEAMTPVSTTGSNSTNY